MTQNASNIIFEKFEILETLQKDSFTGVYLANHIFLHKKIILKTLNTVNIPDKDILKRFKLEARILAKLDHPNIIKVLDFGTFKDNFYISFEYFKSRNLREIIIENKLNDEQKIHVIRQFFKGLEYAHNNHILHRDIKPENILLNEDNSLKIADFGLALALNEEHQTTKTSIVGTPGYMSPEQIRGEDLSVDSDFFSAGLVIYELFTGINPVIGKDINQTINNILKIDNKIINEHISNLPEEIQIVLRKLLQKSNDKRFKKASEILNFLPGTTLEPEVSIQKNEKTGKMKTNYWYILIPASIIIFSIIFSIKYINLKDNLSGKKQLAPDVKSSDTVTSKLPDDSTLTSGLNRKNKDNENIENKKTEKATTINNISDKNISENKTKEIKPGKLNIKCSPWANIYIDLKKIDTTPLDEPLSIPPGDYILQLLHPQYPEYAKKITITENKTFNIMVDFDTLYGYLDCKVYPWGEVFIDNKLIGQTPFKKPIILTPGSHLLTIINPQFKRYDKEITISRQKTVQLKINFEELEE